MARPRLLFFLSDVDGNLAALRQTLRPVCDEVALGEPEIVWAEGPSGFAESGWRIAEVIPGDERAEAVLDGALQPACEALARDFRERAVGILLDHTQRHARAAQCQPGRPARLLEGEFPDVLRQAAHWLTVDTLALARLLGEPRRNVLAAEADFGDGPKPPPDARPTPVPPEPDEDDRFVEAKLAQARAFMAQYLGNGAPR